MDPTQQPPSQPMVSMPGGGHHHIRMPKILDIVLVSLLVISLAAFGWTFSRYRSVKSDVDGQIAKAVDEAKAAQKTELEAGFQTERDRLFNTYTTDPVLGNIKIQYPRDWSFYLDQSTSANTQISAIFHPTVVAKANPGTYALRLKLVQDLYADVVKDFQNEIEKGVLNSTPFKSNNVEGVRLDGQIDTHHTGAMIILPIRDKTLVISTESTDYIKVFNDTISKLVFTP